MGNVTWNMWHVAPGLWHAARGMWHVACGMFRDDAAPAGWPAQCVTDDPVRVLRTGGHDMDKVTPHCPCHRMADHSEPPFVGPGQNCP